MLVSTSELSSGHLRNNRSPTVRLAIVIDIDVTHSYTRLGTVYTD